MCTNQYRDRTARRHHNSVHVFMKVNHERDFEFCVNGECGAAAQWPNEVQLTCNDRPWKHTSRISPAYTRVMWPWERKVRTAFMLEVRKDVSLCNR